MIAFLLPLLSGGFKFFTSKAGLITMAVVAAFFASIWAVHHFESIGRADEVAKEKAATAHAQAQLDAAILVANTKAAADAQRIADKEKTNADVLATIGRLSARNDSRGCLDAAGVSDSVSLDSQKLFASLAAAKPPAELVKPCDPPVDIPAGAASAGFVQRGWGHDRDALETCGERHSAVLDFYRNRDAGLVGK